MGKTIRGARARQRSRAAPAARSGPKRAYTAEGGGRPRPLTKLVAVESRHLTGYPTPSSAAARASGFGTRSLAGLRSSTGSPRAIPRENESWPATPREGALANATVTTGCLCFILLASWLLPRYRALAGHDATASYRRLSPLKLETRLPRLRWRLSLLSLSQAGHVVNNAGL